MKKNICWTMAGHTLLEVMIASAILVVVFAFFFEILIGTKQYSSFTKSELATNTRLNKILYKIRDDFLLTYKIWNRTEDDGTPCLYRRAIELSNEYPPLYRGSDSDTDELPKIDGDGTDDIFGVDGTTETIGAKDITHSNKTGNFLFFLIKQDTMSFDLDNDEVADYFIDLYRFVAYYPSVKQNDSSFPCNYSVRLVRWQSHVFAPYNQIMKLDDGGNPASAAKDTYPRHKILSILLDERGYMEGPVGAQAKVFYVADFNKTPQNAFFAVEEVDDNDYGVTYYKVADDNPTEHKEWDPDDLNKDDPIIKLHRSEEVVNFHAGYSLGLNHVYSRPRATKYCSVDNMFPGGIEVQILKDDTAYTALLRVVLMKKATQQGHIVTKQGELIIRSSSQ